MKKRKLTTFITAIAVVITTAFSSVMNLTSCYGEDNPFVIEDNVLRSYKGEEEDIIVPDGVVEIGEYAFRDAENLMNVTLPDSVEKISTGAFEGCGTLQRINIPKNVKEIGVIAFADCFSLHQIAIEAEDVEIASGAFSGSDLIDEDGYIVVNDILFGRKFSWDEKHWTLPENVKRIDGGAFEELHISSFVIPEGCEEIATSSILLCPVLEELVIPKTVTVIEEHAISDCNKDLIIYGYQNSAAQDYATKNHIDFRIIGVDGDADCNGILSLEDANYVLKAALGIIELKHVEESIANIDKKGGVTLEDASATLKLALGIISVKEILMKNMDYVVENQLDISVETDKVYYVSGDTIELSVAIENNSIVPIPIAGRISTQEAVSSITTMLVDASGNVISKENSFKECNGELFMSEFAIGESLVVERTIQIPESSDDEYFMEKDYYIQVEFRYGVEVNGEYDIKNYVKLFPVELWKR